MKIRKSYFRGLLAGSAMFLQAAGLQAQQVPLYSQYYFNPFLYNPAQAGRNDNTSAYLITRNQWAGMPGAPVTRAFTVDGSLKAEKVGVGFAAYTDATDIFEKVGASISYAYRLNFSEKHFFAMGLSVGALDNRINFEKIRVRDLDDQKLMNQFNRRLSFDGTFGLRYVFGKLEAGVAIPQLLAPKVKYFDNDVTTFYSLTRHFMGSLKYAILFADDNFRLEPMVLAQYAPGAPMQIDGSLTLGYKQKAWLGVMYRHNFAITGSAAIKLHDRVILGYSYDVITSDIAPFAGGTHEVMVGITFGKAVNNDKKEKALLDRIANMEDKQHQQDKAIDSLGTVAANNEQRADKTEEKMEELEKRVDEFENFKQDMADTTRQPRVQNGTIIALNNVYFGNQNGELLPTSYEQINQLAEIMSKSPQMKIEVTGFSDANGPADFNQKLSVERANSVKKQLVAKGINPDRIVVRGQGEKNPLGNNNSEEGRKLNRRVEFKVLDK